MSLVALDNAVNLSPMQRRFHADPRVQAAELLLQERIPHLVPLKNPPIEKAEHIPATRRLPALQVRRYVTPHTLSPRVHLLSNGSYAVMVTNAGGGYSRRQSLAMTRWREDITADAWGTFIYVRDLDSGEVWSTTYQPTEREPDEYEVTFAPDRATWRRVDGDIEIRTEIVVSPEDDVELRRVSVTNHGRETRSFDLTSYAEVVLAPGDADLAHPAFSNLFVETTAVPERDALICIRRPRSGTDRLHLIHVLSGRGRAGRRDGIRNGSGALHRPRPRRRSAGGARHGPRRCRTPPAPSSIRSSACGNRSAFRRAARPASRSRPDLPTTRTCARQLIEKYHDRRAVARALALASTHSQIELRHLGLTIDETHAVPAAGGPADVRRSAAARRPTAVRTNTRGQAELWKYGISGDLPILLLRLEDESGVPLLSRPAEGARISPAQGAGLRSRRAERARVQLSAGSAEHAAADGRERS